MPQQLYRPSMVVNLRLRFDEAFQDPSLSQLPPPLEPAERSSRLAGKIAALPNMLAGAKDDLSFVFGMVPLRAQIELPGYRLAGKWSIDMLYRDFPFDPRVIRACGVEIHLGAVLDDDFATGVSTSPRSNQLRKSQLRTRDDDGNIRKETLLLIGTMDSSCVTHGTSGSLVTMEGRDLRGVLLDTPIRPSVLQKLDLKKPINEVVGQLLAPLGSKITVGVQENDWGGKVPSPAVKENLTRWRTGANGLVPNPTFNADPHSLNYWDVITKYCFLVGAVPYFVGEELRIRRARSLYDLANQRPYDPDQSTPFAGNTQRTIKTQQGEFQTPIRIMAYGRDIEELKFERKVAGAVVPVVECVCVDSSSNKRGFQNRLLRARWPDVKNANPFKVAKAKTTFVDPSGERTNTQPLIIPISGVRNLEQLREIAKDVFQEIGRGEMGGSCSTKDLASLGGDSTDPDLLHLRPGDPVRFTVDARGLHSYPPAVAELIDQQNKSPLELANALAARLGDRKLASTLAAAITNASGRLPNVFRVSNAKYTFDAKSGVGIDFDFQNYVEARFDTEKATAVVPKKPIRQASGE